jgi:hypothetical protein
MQSIFVIFKALEKQKPAAVTDPQFEKSSRIKKMSMQATIDYNFLRNAERESQRQCTSAVRIS